MSNREINIRCVLFLVVGILLLLSLVICIYIVASESDLAATEATVINIEEVEGTKEKHRVYFSYIVDGTAYSFDDVYKKNYEKGETIKIYYHTNDASSSQPSKTPKAIFLCPFIGLILCSLGLYELLKKNKTDAVVSNKETNTISELEPVKLVVPEPEKPISTTSQSSNNTSADKKTNTGQQTEETTPAVKNTLVTEISIPDIKEETSSQTSQSTETKQEVVSPENLPIKKNESVAETKEETATKPATNNMKSLDELSNKVKKSVSNNLSNASGDEEIKDVIKAVLKEVIKEVNEEKTEKKEVVQQRVIPNYFYISGTSLIYEEVGKKAKEISLKDIKRIVRTINKAGNVVKVIVSNEEYKIILTNMKNIDLEQLANLLHNKMRTVDDSFKEEIERKEY